MEKIFNIFRKNNVNLENQIIESKRNGYINPAKCQLKMISDSHAHISNVSRKKTFYETTIRQGMNVHPRFRISRNINLSADNIFVEA